MGNSMTDNIIPIVEGRLTPSGTQITIKCPYCGKKHLHGAPEGDEAEHRRAHCWEPAALKKAGPGYFIKTSAWRPRSRMSVVVHHFFTRDLRTPK